MFRPVHPSQTLLIHEQSQQAVSGGRTVYRFGFGQSPFLPPMFVIEALKAHAHRKEYTPVAGIQPLRDAIAHFHAQADGRDIDASQVLVAPGSKALLYAVMAAFERLEVLIPAPAWVSYGPQAALLGHRVVPVPLAYPSRWRVTPQGLEQALSGTDPNTPKLLILNYPGNPDGLSYNEEELRALAEIARRHALWVVADEIYGLLDHAGQHRSFACYYPERTMVTTGLSKWCGAGGWRLGAVILPPACEMLQQTLIGIGSEIYSCAPTPVQYAALEAYQWEAVQPYLQHQRRILSMIGCTVVSALQQAGLDVHVPQGGFYLLVDFRPFRESLAPHGITTSTALCEHLFAETGVALLPMSAFGMEEQYLAARLSYVDIDGASVMAASEAIGLGAPLPDDFVLQYMVHQMEGIVMLVDYITEYETKPVRNVS